MNYKKLLEKRDFVNENMFLIPKEVLENYEETFAVGYTYDSTTIEGNTLTKNEMAIVLGDHISIGGKNMREIYEVINHNNAYNFLRESIAQNKPLDENMIKDFHMILTENIIKGGFYRDHQVYIKGAEHIPPSPKKMYDMVKVFYQELATKTFDNYIELAAWTHGEFVKIHPFADGNGRTSRLIMNYQLMLGGFLPVSIPNAQKLEYFDSLDKYHTTGDLTDFAELIAKLEEGRLDIYIQAIEDSKK